MSGLGHPAAIAIIADSSISSNSLVMKDGARAVTRMREIDCAFNAAMLQCGIVTKIFVR